MGTGTSVIIPKAPHEPAVASTETTPGAKKQKTSLRRASRVPVRSGEHHPGRKESFGVLYKGALKKTQVLQEPLAEVSKATKKKVDLAPQDSALPDRMKTGRKKDPLHPGGPDLPGGLEKSPVLLTSATAIPGTQKTLPSARPVLWGPVQNAIRPDLPRKEERKGPEGPSGLEAMTPSGDQIPSGSVKDLPGAPAEARPFPEIPRFPLPGGGADQKGSRKDNHPAKGEDAALLASDRTVLAKGVGIVPPAFSGGNPPGSDLPPSRKGSVEGKSISVAGGETPSPAAPLQGTMGVPEGFAGAGSLSGASGVSSTDDRDSPVLPPGLPVRVDDLAKRGGGEVSLEVKPPHLGPVGVRVRIDPHTRLVSVELSSHDSRIRHLLSGKEGSIKESLSQSGFVLDRFQVGSSGAPGILPGQDSGASGFSSGMGNDVRRDNSGGEGSGGSESGSFQSGPSGQESGHFSRQGASGAMGQDRGSGSSPERDRIDRVEGVRALEEDPSLPAMVAPVSGTARGYHRIV